MSANGRLYGDRPDRPSKRSVRDRLATEPDLVAVGIAVAHLPHPVGVDHYARPGQPSLGDLLSTVQQTVPAILGRSYSQLAAVLGVRSGSRFPTV